MHFQDITLLLNIQELNIVNIDHVDDKTVIITANPKDYIQNCPYCKGNHVIRNGINSYRKIRHLPAFEKTTYLLLPAISMKCTQCDVTFTWEYECVLPNCRYTKAVQKSIVSNTIESTIKHTSDVLHIPYSTVERVYKQWMEQETIKVKQDCIQDAINSDSLIIGIDDFAIRKGHSYNTGIHDLRGESLLEIVPGRTLQSLKDYFDNNTVLYALNPKAVVMDLATAYHSFIKETYPTAIRVADRFHVNRYVTEALQEVRKEVQKKLTPKARKHLKSNYKVLTKRNDQLTSIELKLLNQLLQYSEELKQVYEWKEAFIDWYDYRNTKNPEVGFNRWLNQGDLINIEPVKKCLKTMRNWQQEIINYHYIGFTNGIVEGRNNKIKAIQRRHYFTRNPKSYNQRIILECNRERVSA